MAQLKVKQISDFVSAVGTIHDATVGTASSTAISTALSSALSADVVAKSEAISAAVSADVVVLSSAKSYADQAELDAISSAVSQAEAKDVVRASTAVANISTAKSEAISTAVSADVVVLSSAKSYADAKDVITLSEAKAYSDIQKGRIDVLLQDSTAALDTFKEISDFITSLDTADVAGLSAALSTAVSNDAVHASGISANADAIDALETAVAGLEASTVDLSLIADGLSNTIENTGGDDVTLRGATPTEAGLMIAEDYNKLAGIEAGADVTDYTNVEAAGALMDNEIENLDQVKSFNSSDYDAAGSAFSAYNDAVSYANGLAVNYDAVGSAATAESNANDYTDSAIRNLNLGDIITYNAEDFDAAGSAATAESNAIASANGYTDDEISALETSLLAAIDNVAGVDKTEQIATVNSTTEFSVLQPYSLDNNDILVFINGLQIHNDASGDGFRTLNGRDFIVNLPYEIDENDHIVVIGVLVA